tara:strand:+ start:6026 stop:7360 length:1335 start_codon:yes stop_codon:yes gene_type:complete
MKNYVFGLNKSGSSILELLKLQKKNYYCWDDDKKTRQKIKKKFPKAKFLKINKNNINNFDKIYLTPGISIYKEPFNKKISKIKRDLNLYYDNLVNEKIIAITGTNGKSTTTKLIGNIFKKKFNRTFVGGNIGKPLCNSILKKNKYSHHIIELSSFQLETIKNFRTNISILLNIFQDHLDRYESFKDYINVKKNILNSSKKNINLISIDDKNCFKIFNQKKIENKISFSIYNDKADIYFNEGYLVDKYFYNLKKIKISNLSHDLRNVFNMQSILVAYICCKIFKIPISIFMKEISSYKGLPFRSSIIYNSKTKIVINDSKATNINASISNLKNKKNVFLIIGGIAKENNFKKFNRFDNEISQMYIYGKSRFLINKQLKLRKPPKIFDKLSNLIDSILKDSSLSKNKATILFAPACASFDQFASYQDRGKYFNKLIRSKLKNYEHF